MVVTQPPRPKGRHYALAATPVEELARERGMSVFSPENVNSKEAIEYINTFSADIFIVVSYGQILSENLLRCPKIYPIAIHPSLLPKYRGASPIQSAILNGDKYTGVTAMLMDEGLDTGDILCWDYTGVDKK